MTARSAAGDRDVQGVDHREVERDDAGLHEDRAAEAADERRRLFAEAVQRVGQRVDAVADPFGMQDGERLQQPAEPGRRDTAGTATAAPTTKPAQSHDGQIGQHALPVQADRHRSRPRPRRERAPSGRARGRPARPSWRASWTAPRARCRECG